MHKLCQRNEQIDFPLNYANPTVWVTVWVETSFFEKANSSLLSLEHRFSLHKDETMPCQDIHFFSLNIANNNNRRSSNPVNRTCMYYGYYSSPHGYGKLRSSTTRAEIMAVVCKCKSVTNATQLCALRIFIQCIASHERARMVQGNASRPRDDMLFQCSVYLCDLHIYSHLPRTKKPFGFSSDLQTIVCVCVCECVEAREAYTQMFCLSRVNLYVAPNVV